METKALVKLYDKAAVPLIKRNQPRAANGRGRGALPGPRLTQEESREVLHAIHQVAGVPAMLWVMTLFQRWRRSSFMERLRPTMPWQ